MSTHPDTGGKPPGDPLAPRRIDIEPDLAAAVVPALLGDALAGTDRLLVLRRLRLDRPVVYVAFVPPEVDAPPETPPYVLYVGATRRGIDERIGEHLTAADSRAGGLRANARSVVPGGAQIMHAALWAAVPVDGAFLRPLEDALTFLLRPVLQRHGAARRKTVRLGGLHVEAMVSAGWAREAATAWIARGSA